MQFKCVKRLENSYNKTVCGSQIPLDISKDVLVPDYLYIYKKIYFLLSTMYNYTICTTSSGCR